MSAVTAADGVDSVLTVRRKAARRRGAASPQASDSADPRTSNYRLLSTLPALSTFQLSGDVCLDATPGVLALGGPNLGLAVINTAAPAPFPVISLRDSVELGGANPTKVVVDPFAPHHKYVGAACTSGRVVAVSSRAGYQFMEKHDLHTSPVSALTWTMALHASPDQVPWADKRLEASARTQPLSTTTGRALLSVDAAGNVASLDPVSGASSLIFALPAGQYDNAETSSGLSMSTWTAVTAVAFRFYTATGSPPRDGSFSDSGGSESDSPPDRTTSASPARGAVSSASVGVNIVLCDTTAAVVVRCIRSDFGNRLMPAEWADESQRRPSFTIVTLGKSNGALRMSSSPWASGMCLLSRPLHRFWVLDGAGGRIAASHKVCATNGGNFDESSWGASAFAAADVWTPPWARSGVLRRHLVVLSPSPGALQSEPSQMELDRSRNKPPPLLQLAVLLQSGDDVTTWRFESSAWDTVPHPIEASESLRVSVVLSACAIADSLGSSEVHGTSPTSKGVVFAPCCFVLAAGRLLSYVLPGDIAVTPLLEAFLRERYGCPTVDRVPLSISPGNQSNSHAAPAALLAIADAVSFVAKETYTAASTMLNGPKTTAPTPSFVSDVIRGVASRLGSEGRQEARSESPETSSPTEESKVVAIQKKPKKKQRAVVVYADPALIDPLTPLSSPAEVPSASLRHLSLDETSETLLASLDLRERHMRDIATLQADFDHSRSTLRRDEDHEWSMIYGRHLHEAYRLEEAALAVKRVTTTREAATIRFAASQERSRTLRPISNILQEMVANPTSTGERLFAKTVLCARRASDEQLDTREGMGESRVRPWPALIEVQERDRKLFDLAELRLAQEAKEQELAATAISLFVVFEEWRRVSANNDEDAWRPCRDRYTMACDGTSVDLESLLHSSDPSWIEPAFHVSNWKYGKRWPANEEENTDPHFWYEPAVAIGEGSGALLPNDFKVRRRIWSRRQRSAVVEQKVRELKARHQTEYAARERALLGER